MKVEILTICDYAGVELTTGKINIIGTFDTLWGSQAPISQLNCAIAGRVRFESTEEGQKKMGLSFIDSDGRPIMPAMNLMMSFTCPPGVPTATVPICAIIQQINLPSFGEYSVVLTVDNRVEGSTPLYVRQKPSPHPPPA